jgi:hypothetical protein
VRCGAVLALSWVEGRGLMVGPGFLRSRGCGPSREPPLLRIVWWWVGGLAVGEADEPQESSG